MEIASQNQHCPSLLSSRSLLFLLGAAICTPLCPQAGAQHPATVNVIFHSRLPAYRPPTAVEQEISAHVAKICADKFPHWRYRAGTDADFPQLRVEITQESNDKRLLGLSLVVDRDQPVGPGSRWREPLFAPGDAILRPVMPTDAEAPTFFAEAFEQQLLSNPVILREILAALSDAVPLGGSVVLIPPQRTSENPRAVLPIEWGEHCREFAESEFVIFSRAATSEKIRLFSAGLSLPLDYKPDQRQFDGVGVQLNSWQKAGDPAPRAIESSSQVLALTPIEFHLKESKPHLQSCKADAGLAPSVAP